MPTYRNDSGSIYILQFEEGPDNRAVAPGDVVETRAYYNQPSFTLLSHEPLVEWIGASGKILIDDTTGVTLTVNGYSYIQLYSTADFKVFYNDATTTPDFYPAGLVKIDNSKNTGNEILVKALSGSATLIYSIKKEP